MFVLLFFLGIASRFLLFLGNREANDNHVEVAQRIFASLPVERENCWECFQPKLYHSTIAFIEKLPPTHTLLSFILIGQGLSLVTGILTLVILWKFFREYGNNKSSFAALVAFACIVCNPALIGITVQATNDSFMIFFSTLAVYALWKYLKRFSFVSAGVIIVSTTLAALSKGSGLAVFLFVFFILLLQIGHLAYYKLAVKKMVVVFIVFTSIVIFALTAWSPYFHYYVKYGDPFIINIAKPPLPAFFTNTFVLRPGITSIASGYFTFRFRDLLAHPYTTHAVTGYTIQRTSFWSQLYGKFNSIHFENALPEWQNQSEQVLTVTRMIFIFALPLLALTLFGYIVQVIVLTKHVMKKTFTYRDFRDHFLFVFFFTAILAMNILYSYLYRDFAFIRAIFLLPAIISIGQCLFTGIETLITRLAHHKIITSFLSVYCLLLCCLYLYDVWLLIYQLRFAAFALL